MSMSVPAQYFADLVEYSVGGADTPFGALRISDGHPGLYEPYAWELGNEQYNPNFVAQVAAMEAKATALQYKPKWFYMCVSAQGVWEQRRPERAQARARAQAHARTRASSLPALTRTRRQGPGQRRALECGPGRRRGRGPSH